MPEPHFWGIYQYWRDAWLPLSPPSGCRTLAGSPCPPHCLCGRHIRSWWRGAQPACSAPGQRSHMPKDNLVYRCPSKWHHGQRQLQSFLEMGFLGTRAEIPHGACVCGTGCQGAKISAPTANPNRSTGMGAVFPWDGDSPPCQGHLRLCPLTSLLQP